MFYAAWAKMSARAAMEGEKKYSPPFGTTHSLVKVMDAV
jgi:hypothetical protein